MEPRLGVACEAPERPDLVAAQGACQEQGLRAMCAAIWPVGWISSLGVGVKSGLLLATSYRVYRTIHP